LVTGGKAALSAGVGASVTVVPSSMITRRVPSDGGVAATSKRYAWSAKASVTSGFSRVRARL